MKPPSPTRLKGYRPQQVAKLQRDLMVWGLKKIIDEVRGVLVHKEMKLSKILILMAGLASAIYTSIALIQQLK